MKINSKFKFAAAVHAVLFLCGSVTIMQSARGGSGPTLSAAISFTEIFSQQYDLTYYNGTNWVPLTTFENSVSLVPRFSYEQSPPLASSYKYGLEIFRKNNSTSTFYLFISTNNEPCIIQKTDSNDTFTSATLGIAYNITTQYTNLSSSQALNSNTSPSYSVCSRQNMLSIRLFDPVASGIPIGIGSYVTGGQQTISETYIILNTEGILYP